MTGTPLSPPAYTGEEKAGCLTLNELLLVLALVTDAFIACFAYGAQGIRIPWPSALLVGGVGTGVLLLSMTVSAQLGRFLPQKLCTAISFGVIFSLGFLSVFQNAVKSALAKRTDAAKRLRFRWAGISFAVTVYLDETKADADHSKVLSPREALLLGAVLSLDSFGIGLGSGLSPHRLSLLCGLSLILHPAAVLLGRRIGQKTAGKLPEGVSSLGGVLLIILAFLRLF